MYPGERRPATTATIAFILLTLRCSRSAIISRCSLLPNGGQVCFHQPDPALVGSWLTAQQWCRANGYTLPIIVDSYSNNAFGNAAGFFGLSSQNLWLGANSTTDVNNWKWLNGTRFSGTVVGGDNISTPYAYAIRNGSDISYAAAAPFERMNHVCQYPNTELWCSAYANSLWLNGKCYIKYKYNYPWFSARSNCGYYLAMFDNLNDTWKWLDEGLNFWVGLRSNWWNWQDAGSSIEVTYQQFKYGFPTLSAQPSECLTALNGEWMNTDCAASQQFICQQNLNVTTTTTTTTTTTSTTASATAMPASASTMPITSPGIIVSTLLASSLYSSTLQTHNDKDELKLGVGLGVGLVMAALVIWLGVITLILLRMKRTSRESNVQPNTMPTATELNGAASINHNDTMPPGSTYQSLHRTGIPTDDRHQYQTLNQTNNTRMDYRK